MSSFSNQMDGESEKSIPLLKKGRSSNDEIALDLDNIIEVGGGIGSGVNIKKEEFLHSSSTGENYSHLMNSIGGQFEWDKGCFFSDGMKQIDYVLAYEEEGNYIGSESSAEDTLDQDFDEDEGLEKDPPCDTASPNEKKRKRRMYFEANLEKMGLELERVEIAPQLGRTRFVLIHAPFYVLEKQAQILSVKLPVKQSDVYFQDRTYLPGIVDRALACAGIFDFSERTKGLLEEPAYFTAPYSSDRRQQFVNWDRPDILFPNAERSRMVYDLLTRAHYDNPLTDRKKGLVHYRFGIERLLAGSTYSAAYPLHQELRYAHDSEEISQRELLYKHWVSWKNLLKYQPLDGIKRYFGTRIAFYFAWLGYYTRSLYFAAFVGLLCVAYGLYNVSEDIVSNDICGSDGIGTKVLICPQCENYCDFQRLNSSCVYAKMSYLFDNGATVIFAALMSIWATLFLEGWKRYHAEIAWKWGLLDFVVEEDTVRPEFQFRVKTKRYNPVTQKEEPYLSGKKKLANYITSGVTVLFFVLLVVAVVFGMVVYRVICMRLLARADNPTVDSYAFLIVSITAAFINLVVILFMNYFYNSLAHRLTRWEYPRTQADFDNSYTFKVFLFQFVNYYSSLFYVAFFKGVLSQLPGTRDYDGNVKIAGYRLEGCDPAGCFVELVIQLAIIMCGKQFISALMEYAYPNIMGLLRKWQLRIPMVVETKEQRKERIREEHQKKAGSNMTRWEADYYLNPTYDQFLFDEYLEMVLQFGFVTIFVAAFPLAPLFAVINNIMEIRLDAYKFLCTTQRPMPAQAKNIGVWLSILDVLSKASVTINALVIAFTSDFVPKTMYYLNHHTMIGYVESSLSYFDATDFYLKTTAFGRNITVCRYRGYRHPPCTLQNITSNGNDCDDDLGVSFEWWKVFAARLLFVVVFEHVVFIVKLLFEYLIPDVPTRIFVQQQREKYLLRKALLSELASGGKNSRPSEHRAVAKGDSEETAFQPGSFTDDQMPSADYDTYRPRLSMNTVSLESFETAIQDNGSIPTLSQHGE